MREANEKRFLRDFGSLPEIFRFVDARIEDLRLEEAEKLWAYLVVEELFTNMVKYSPEGSRKIAVRLDGGPDRLTVRLTDFDVDEFDVTQVPEVDVDRPLRERTPGGLGLHFVRKSSDSVAYEYKNRSSIITVTRRLER